MQKDSICSIIRQAEDDYVNGTTKIGEHVHWSMHDTIENITAYLNSKHTSGPEDALGREKPFFNIVLAARNVWWRATDIDRKDIKFMPNSQSATLLAFIANVLLQNWMQKHRFGQFLNSWGLALSSYGSAIVKFVDRDGELFPSVTPWNRAIVDPVDFNSLPRIEKLYKTPGQLRNMATPGHPDYANYDMEIVESLCDAAAPRKNLDGTNVDDTSEFVELYEVHGLLPVALLEDEPHDAPDELWEQFRQQMHVVSYVAQEKGGYDDYTLFKGRERQDPYMITHLIEEDGRTLSIGAVESLFDAQWMQNHSMKQMKDTLDISSKIIMQTADGSFVGRNMLTAVESGDIFIHQPDRPLTQINNSKADITAFDQFRQQWELLGQTVTSTPDAIRGNTMPSGTPYSLAAYSGAQANSLFEIMTENKGLAIEDMMRQYVIPHLKKQLKNKDEIVAILDAAGIEEIDAMYVPKAAVRRFNKNVKEALIKGEVPEAYNPQEEEKMVKQELSMSGNKRFFKPDELGQKQWDEIFTDFNWDNIRVEVTNENVDKQAVLTTLSAVLQTIATNPLILQDPNAKMVFSQILTETGRISPLQLSSASGQASPMQPQVPAGGGAEALSAVANAQ